MLLNVEIQKSRFQVNDPYILSVGLFRGVVDGAVEAPVPVPAAVEELETPVEDGDELEILENTPELTESAESPV